MSDLHALLFEREVPYRCTTTMQDDTSPYRARVDVWIESADAETLTALLRWKDGLGDREVSYSGHSGFKISEYIRRDSSAAVPLVDAEDREGG